MSRRERARGLFSQLAVLSPLTVRGFLVALLSGVFLWTHGYGALDLILFVVGVSGLALVSLCLVAVGVGALFVRRSTAPLERSDTQHLEAGTLHQTGFSRPGLQRLPLVHLSWQVERPAAVDAVQALEAEVLTETVTPWRRCEATELVRRLRVECVFGLARWQWLERTATSLTVLPSRGRLVQLPIAQSLASADGTPHPAGMPEGDRMEIRRYVPGDSARDILWKKFASTRQLSVRMREASVDPARRTVAYLVAGPRDEPAAAAVRLALESGVLGGRWLFGVDGRSGATERLDEALQWIAASGNREGHEVEPASGLERFLEQCDRADHGVVFCSGETGPWVERLEALARTRAGGLSFVLGIDAVVRPRHESRWRRFALAAERRHGVSAGELNQLVQRLGRVAVSVVVAERGSGRTRELARRRVLGAVA